MELEVSALTRRDRLERIASAERDRRAGRIDLALATLGDAGEWPARIVLALIRLPEDEGADARCVLESTLDDWASETGLSLVEIEEMPLHVIDAAEPFESLGAEDVLESPIEVDELDRAFAEAEAQTDEMHDVNSVAERVLMTEPMGLAELSGDVVDAIDEQPAEIETERDAHASIPVSSSFSTSEWAPVPESTPSEIDAASVPPMSRPFAARTDLAEADWADERADQQADEQSERGVVLATLERWLSNLEKNANNRTGRPR